MPIVSFADSQTESFFIEGRTGKGVKWSHGTTTARRKLDLLNFAVTLMDLAAPPGNRLEALAGDLEGFHSIRINDQWRVVFVWTGPGANRGLSLDYALGSFPMIRINRRPTSPGEILREEFLLPLKLTQQQLADHIGSDVKVINRLVNGRAQLSPKIALKLAATFNTTPDFWLNAQRAVDIYTASRQLKRLPKCLLNSINVPRIQ